MSRRRAFEDDEVTFGHQSKRPCSGLISHDRYTVAWICALHIEMAAARAMLDEEHDTPPKTDSNSYVLGTIQRQHVVIACLPAYGTNNAAIVMSNLKRTFPNINVCLMVGIGGGVPTKADIRLGDVVVGTRVMQYDLGKTINGELQRTGICKHPGSSILTVISNLRSRHELEGSRIPTILKHKMDDYPTYGLPTKPDRLFKSSYKHPFPDFSCDECDQGRLEVRKARISNDPVIYYGGIASSNQVMKDATCRDKIGSELDILCFEMEAAGLMDIESCLPIRGICDYSDSHKAKGWQRYAAATAAAYAYELLEVRGQDGRNVDPDKLLITGNFTNILAADKKPTPEQRRAKILKSLDFEAIDSRKTTIKAAHSKTCHWFLKHKDYLAWKDPAKVSEHHGFLWIRGKPGAGKSTIMKFIYLETRKKDKKDQILTASFFFNARGEALEKTISGMYRSLLLQLFKGFPDLQLVLDDSDLLPQSQMTCPSLNSLKDLLRSAILKLNRRSFTCFIDALDECDEQQIMDLVYFFEDVAETCTESSVRLQICFSSRHYPYIDIDRGMRITVEDQEGHASDLETYVKSNLRIKDPALVAQLLERMLVKGSGVFLWMVLVVDVLNDENRRGRLNLRNRLEQVPDGLSELFKDILRRDNSNMEELQLCLLWILLSKRPLKPAEYYHALWSGLSLQGLADSETPSVDVADASDCFYKSVINSSKGLARITKANEPTVQFIHESVRDFLVKDKGLAEIWPEFKVDWEGFGHDKLKRCCHFYLQLPFEPRIDSSEVGHACTANSSGTLSLYNVDSKYPFLGYAGQYVLYHADLSANTYCQQTFLREFPLRHWIGCVTKVASYWGYSYSSEAEMLYILAENGYSSLIRTRLKTDPEIDFLCPLERYRYPLIASMAEGHKDSVLALLGLIYPNHNGVDVTKGIIPDRGFSAQGQHTPLSWACENGCLGVAKLLVERGATRASNSDWTLLMYAVKGRHIEVARWLIDIGEDVRACTNRDSVISLAIMNDDTEMVKLLLESGIEPDYINPGSTLIPSIPFPEIVGHSVTNRNNTVMSILHLALYHEYGTIAKMIVDKGGDVEIADSFGRRPIHYAKSMAEMRLLLENGADINSGADTGETCLWNVALYLEVEQLEFLIKKGARVNARRDDGQTCLFQVVRQNRFEKADLLCANGADVNIQDKNGNSCLHYASTFLMGSPIVQLLLNYGANTKVMNLRGETYLHWYCMKVRSQASDAGMSRILENDGIDINTRDSAGNTPLHFLARFIVSGGVEESLDFWLRHGADINARNYQGRTPLDIAQEGNNEAGSRCLILKGALKGTDITHCPMVRVTGFSREDHGNHGC